ncbi:outer membrane beta-barrel protein [Mucilaginibacter sp. BT774]|uniref:outer membrane beta-barrel protein n=1 Tax=Mucilaginibacter sp. BT774 TaxID=3062276 RepID=UPI002674A546|nr:outer membrane beta-barrel protein [Mucilaginibacter sp. BT774]MDO3626670.1 outer membrane beta-barrel protein [Mucilaginibacter sp. BT774]
MKRLFLIFLFSTLISLYATAQTGREVHGTVTDSTKLGVPGANIKLISDKGDSTVTITDPTGKFVFPAVNGTKLTLTVSSIGYQRIKKHFSLDADTKPATLGTVILKQENNTLQGVTIVGVNPVTLKEDTVEYKASAYKVRENAPVEDLIKKLPGVDVDVNGNITTQGKQVTKVRINGKDFMGGDVQSATKNLPADVVENIQMIDDYGDQANLTGVKTGEPDKIMNITIRKDKNYGYFGQATAGDGEDALPKSQGLPDDNRYLFNLNAFRFNGDQQMALLGSVNNTNVNTFSFNSNTGGGGGGGGFGGGGGGRGNAARGAQNSGSLITTQNGITDAHSIGANFRDQWGKKLSVYGSYSVSDNTVSTNSTNFQQNTSLQNPSTINQRSNELDKNFNERFTWNMEYKPDTVNYLKITPTFTYATTRTTENEADSTRFPYNPIRNAVFNTYTSSTSNAPAYGITALYNHRFHRKGRNFSLNVNINSAPSTLYQHVVYNYTLGTPPGPVNQVLHTNSRTTTIGTTLSFLEPIGKRDYLEVNYALSHSHTTNSKSADSSIVTTDFPSIPDTLRSTDYNYNFTTNRFGLNYRFVEKKYNYTFGLSAQPAVLDGYSPLTGLTTHVNTFNWIPTARYIYNFSRSQAFSLNYNGSSSQPSFTQLQPTTDVSNASYPVQGNPFLKPQFTNNFSIRYNQFSFATGNILFANVSFQKIDNQIVTNLITYASKSSILTQYLNADGYYNISGNFTYAKPWDNRKFTLMFTGTVNYSNGVSYLTNVGASGDSVANKNIAKNLQMTPGLRFRVNFTDIIDAQVLTNYVINRTDNSVKNPLNQNLLTRTWNIGVNGKNYFKDWTVSYDYGKAINYGYSSALGKVTNPNILNMYVERRFLKDHRATIRLSAFDLFNQNTGFSTSSVPGSYTETHINRLSRYYLATFTLRLQKFAGKAPTQNPDRDFRRGNRGDGPGGPPPGGGPGGVPQ